MRLQCCFLYLDDHIGYYATRLRGSWNLLLSLSRFNEIREENIILEEILRGPIYKGCPGLHNLRWPRVSDRSILVYINKANELHRLNLTAANQCILIEPQWNPMLEEQATSRLHRLGEPVFIRRFVIRNIFEQKIVERQVRK